MSNQSEMFTAESHVKLCKKFCYAVRYNFPNGKHWLIQALDLGRQDCMLVTKAYQRISGKTQDWNFFGTGDEI